MKTSVNGAQSRAVFECECSWRGVSRRLSVTHDSLEILQDTAGIAPVSAISVLPVTGVADGDKAGTS